MERGGFLPFPFPPDFGFWLIIFIPLLLWKKNPSAMNASSPLFVEGLSFSLSRTNEAPQNTASSALKAFNFEQEVA